MKRKRKSHTSESIQRASKHRKLDESDPRPTYPLLRQYYPRVSTLREYLVSSLPQTSKTRRRKIQQFGGQDGAKTASTPDRALAALLDQTVVGSFKCSNEVAIDHAIDKDITIFSQQLIDSTIATSLTQGAPRQSDIVDFVIWLLFRRHHGHRPSHILCQGYQRTVNNAAGVELLVLPNIPGIFSSMRNAHVEALQEQPWAALPALLGSGAERIISDMLVNCGVFVPVGISSNLNQLSGVPLSELKVLRIPPNNGSAKIRPGLKVQYSNGADGSHSKRGFSEIRFVRHRMFYAKPSTGRIGKSCSGLGSNHILNRARQTKGTEGTRLLAKYLFPRQFGLHNAFTSEIDPKNTAQLFHDYTFRETEIAQVTRLSKDLGVVSEKSRNDQAIPKRLRGKAFQLIRHIQNRHARCSYHALLQFYCPAQQDSSAASGTSSFDRASTVASVSAFCRAVVSKVFPAELWGCGEVGLHNTKVALHSIDRFVRLRRYESMSLHDVMHAIKLKGVEWVTPTKVEQTLKLSSTDYAKRRELMAELLYYLFDSFLIPLIRTNFHVTESSVHRNLLFYFRHDVWHSLSSPALTALKHDMLEGCKTGSVERMLSKRALGVSHVRLLPKESGMRPIVNLRRRTQRLQNSELVLGQSINSMLTPAFSALNYEKSTRPEMLGSALFSVDDIFPRLQRFKASLRERGLGGAPLYFAKVDVQACFDTIPQRRLMSLVKRVLGADQYQIARFARAKLVGDQNPETPGFGAKPSWKFLSKATAGDEAFDFSREIDVDTAGGRSGTVYVDGVAQRVESRHAILNMLEEHVQSHIIKLGKRYYRQRQGIPQGSIVSSLLCSYMYAELEREVLPFVDDGQSMLLRLIDDFMIISTSHEAAARFTRTMHDGVPEFGVRVKVEKSRVNFDISIGQEVVPRLPEGTDFPYCGLAINTGTLDLSKDRERRRKTNVVHTLTVECSRLPGQTFYRKTLNALKLCMHAMLLSTSYNSVQTVLSNLYYSFSVVAQKSYHYIKSMPSNKQPNTRLVIKAIDNVIQLAGVLMKRRTRANKGVAPYKCSVTPAQTRWLACTAFHVVFHPRQTRHGGVLIWLRDQLASPAVRKHGKALQDVAESCEG